jgi:hypothetical protein
VRITRVAPRLVQVYEMWPRIRRLIAVRRHIGPQNRPTAATSVAPCAFGSCPRLVTPIGGAGIYGAVLEKGCGVHQRLLPASLATPTTFICSVVAVLSAIAAGIALSFTSKADVPLYQRRGAFEAACRDAGGALLRLTWPSPVTFADDCRQPTVTPVFNKAGFLIVTRVVMAPKGDATVRRTYSLLMDGRQFDAWRMTEMEQAPNELSVVQAPPLLSPRPSPGLSPANHLQER